MSVTYLTVRLIDAERRRIRCDCFLTVDCGTEGLLVPQYVDPVTDRSRVVPVLRRYRSPDDAAVTCEVFEAAVRGTASAFYSPEQIAAWLGPDARDLGAWDARRRGAFTLVAEVDGAVVGFSDLRDDGLVDMLFVHPAAGRSGVARALLTAVLAEARARGVPELRTFASRSAQPVLARLGFTVAVDRTDNTVRGVVVPNAEMRLRL